MINLNAYCGFLGALFIVLSEESLLLDRYVSLPLLIFTSFTKKLLQVRLGSALRHGLRFHPKFPEHLVSGTKRFLQLVVVCISTAVKRPATIRQISQLTYEKATTVFTYYFCAKL